MKDNKDIIGYIRVSTEEQAEKGFSLDNQRDDIRKYCELRDLNLIGIFSDEGVSGKDIKHRQGFMDMMSFIESGKANGVVIWKASRISRNFLDFAEILKKFESLNCRLLSIKDNYDTADPSSKLSVYMHGIIADLERDNLRVQVRGGMKKRAKQGKFNGGIIPLGYSYDKIAKELHIDEKESRIIKEIFNLYMRGWGYSRISKHLNSIGYKTRKGNNFSLNSVKGILLNPIYMGKIRWEYHKDWNSKKRAGRNDEYTLVDGLHEAIVSEELFYAVQDKIKSNPKHGNNGKPSNYLLSGLLRCPSCGYGMSVQKVSKKSSVNHYYVCGSYQNKKGCKPHSNKMEKIDTQFFMLMQDYISKTNLDTVKKSLEKDKSKEKTEIDIKIKHIKGEIQKQKNTQNNLIKSLEVENAPIVLITQELTKTDTNIRKLNNSLNDLEIERTRQGQDIDPNVVFAMLKNFSLVMDMSTQEERRDFIKKLIKEVHIDLDGNITEITLTVNKSLKIERNHDNKANKKFLITCDTVHRFIS